MGIGQVELQGGIQRLQDFSAIRQNEEDRPVVEQMQTSVEFTEEMQNASERVADSSQTTTDSENMGEGEGGNEYAGDGGRRRRGGKEGEHSPDGVVYVKGADPKARGHLLKGGDFSIKI